MCTVSFIARQRGYLLAMNRDEQLTRAKSLPPKVISASGRKVICPSEPCGGTWIAVNDTGVTFALINWYSVPTRLLKNPISRGGIVNFVKAQSSSTVTAEIMAGLPLKQTNPFRLIGIFPRAQEIVEWRWNLNRLGRKDHSWQARQFISSGFDESEAQLVRSQMFRQAMRLKSAGTPAGLQRLHRSHTPACGPFSTCMHRAGAATVSYAEIHVGSKIVSMTYHAGAPCRVGKQTHHHCQLAKEFPAQAASRDF